MMRKTSARINSGHSGNLPSKVADWLDRSSIKYSADRGVEGDESQRVRHGIDDGVSCDKWKSESTRATAYDFQDVVSAEETSNWMEETMRALCTTD